MRHLKPKERKMIREYMNSTSKKTEFEPITHPWKIKIDTSDIQNTIDELSQEQKIIQKDINERLHLIEDIEKLFNKMWISYGVISEEKDKNKKIKEWKKRFTILKNKIMKGKQWEKY